MTNKYKIGLAIGAPFLLALLAFAFLGGTNIAVLNPKGAIASQQRDLLIIATILMSFVVIPVFALTFTIAWKYREGNKAIYRPNEDGNKTIETIWWTIPLILVVILSGIIWKSSHTLDPYKAIASDRKPIRVQVVSLNWKWLFIYPDQGIASVNYLRVPEDTPINFELTSDAAMNSFWIPQLGGQVYTMNGMQTKLHLIANEQGEYQGQSANLSGEGFAGMKFKAEATSYSDFSGWVSATRNMSPELNNDMYKKLTEPSHDNPPSFYTYNDSSVYNSVISKYLAPAGSKPEGHHAR